MIWAALAAFLTKRPPAVQATVLGLCVGLFVATAAEADNRNPLLNRLAVLVLVAGAIAGGLFYAALAYQRRHAWTPETPAPAWLHAAYLVVWLLGLAAALRALVGDGGFRVAALAIVPLVLVAPAALEGARQLLHRRDASA